MDPLDSDCLFVLGKDTIDHCLFLGGELQVLAARWNGIFDSDRGNLGRWILLDTIGRKGTVDTRTEVLVVDHVLRVIRSLVFGGQSTEFFGREVEAQHGQDLFELVLGDLASSELIKIEEELFNTDPLHHNSSLEALLDVLGVVDGVHSLLQEPIVDDVQGVRWSIIERRSCISELPDLHDHLGFWILCDVLREHVLWFVDIGAKFEIVDLPDIASIKVFPQKELE